MAYDEKTPFLGLPLPHPRNTLREDCPRIRESLQGLDGFAKKTDASLSRLLETDTALSEANAALTKAVQDQAEDLTEAISRETEARSQADADLAKLSDERLKALESRFDESGKLQAENLPLTDALDSATGTLAASDTAVKTLNDKLNGLNGSPADRLLWLGVPRPWRSTALPPSHCWANGDFVAFADWPELEQVYAAGGFEGMLMAWDADSGTQAANPGKWRPDAAEPTGLYVPVLTGQFMRCWEPGADVQAGGYNAPGLPNIIGTFYDVVMYSNSKGTGATYFMSGYSANSGAGVGGGYAAKYGLDASRSNSIYGASTTVMPPSINTPYIIYLGNPAKETA